MENGENCSDLVKNGSGAETDDRSFGSRTAVRFYGTENQATSAAAELKGEVYRD